MSLYKRIVLIIFCFIIFLCISTSVKAKEFDAGLGQDLDQFGSIEPGDVITNVKYSLVFPGGYRCDNCHTGCNKNHKHDWCTKETEKHEVINQYRKNNPIKYYCIEKEQNLYEKPVSDWTVKKVIEISSEKEDFKENEIKSRFAYILKNNEGHLEEYYMNSSGGIFGGIYTQTQMWVYKHANEFLSTIGENSMICEENNIECNTTDETFSDYWNQDVKGELTIGTSRAKQEIYQENGISYLSYGPITFTDSNIERNLNNINVRVKGNLKSSKIFYLENGTRRYISARDITANGNTEYYMCIPESLISNDDEITVSVSTGYYDIYSARIVVLEHNNQQNLILVENIQDSSNHSNEITFNAKINGKLIIKKLDSDTSNFIAGAEFEITGPNNFANSIKYNREDGNKVIVDTINNKITVTINNATNRICYGNNAR